MPCQRSSRILLRAASPLLLLLLLLTGLPARAASPTSSPGLPAAGPSIPRSRSTVGEEEGRRAGVGASPAAVVTWTGAAGDGAWSNPRNWAGGRVPGPGDTARFGGHTPDARMDAAFPGIISSLVLAADYTGTVRLERALVIRGDLAMSGGELRCGTAPLNVEGAARVSGGLLVTPAGAAMNAVTLDIANPGVVRLGPNGKLNLSGGGQPLTGNGLLDTSTHRPNSVEYTGAATADLTAAGPAAGLRLSAPEGFGRVGSLPLAGAEGHLYSAVIDPAGGFAYFGTNTAPGIVLKVRLSDFTRAGALTLNPGEDGLASAVIDPAGGFAYFGTLTTPGIVVKVDLASLTRAGALALNADEDYLLSAAIDPAGGSAYFGSWTTPGHIVKVDLSGFTRAGALTLNAGENHLRSAVIDPAGGFAYFGTAGTPGRVVRVDLSDFSRAGALTLNVGEDILTSAVIDAAAGYAYFGTWTSPGRVVQVHLSDFTRAGALTLNPGEDGFRSAVIDPAGGFAYFGTYTYPGIVVKVRLSDFTRAGALTLNVGEGYLFSAVIDPAGGFAYFGTYTAPGIVVKVRLSDFTRAGALTLNAGEDGLTSAVIDPTAGFAFFGTWTSPGIVAKVRLSDFTRAGALTLNAGEERLTSAVIDPAAGFAYFGTYTAPGIVVKVRLSDFTRAGALTLNAGEDGLTSAVIDPAASSAYFGTYTYPGIVVKVRLSDFSRAGALPLNPGEDIVTSAVIDTAAGYAYFGTWTSPGRVIRVRLSDFTRAGALTLNAGEDILPSAVIDSAAGFAYFGTYTFPGIVVKVDIAVPPFDVSMVKTASPAAARPGAALTYTLAFENVGISTTAGVRITDTIPVSVTGADVISSGVAITPVPGTRYVWQVQDLAPWDRGVITISGVLTGCLPAGHVFTNTATITAAGDSAPANNRSAVAVTVLNVAPLASADTYTTGQDVLLVVPAPGVLGNDSDANCGPLSATLVTPPPSGTLDLRPDGSFIYTPSLGFLGVVTFTYVLSDGVLDDTASVRIAVVWQPWSVYLPLVFRNHSGSIRTGAYRTLSPVPDELPLSPYR